MPSRAKRASCREESFSPGARGPQVPACFCPSLLLVWTLLLARSVNKTATGKWGLLATAESRKAKLHLQRRTWGLPGAASSQCTTRPLVVSDPRSPAKERNAVCSKSWPAAPASSSALTCSSRRTALTQQPGSAMPHLLPADNPSLPLLPPRVPQNHHFLQPFKQSLFPVAILQQG